MSRTKENIYETTGWVIQGIAGLFAILFFVWRRKPMCDVHVNLILIYPTWACLSVIQLAQITHFPAHMQWFEFHSEWRN